MAPQSTAVIYKPLMACSPSPSYNRRFADPFQDGISHSSFQSRQWRHLYAPPFLRMLQDLASAYRLIQQGWHLSHADELHSIYTSYLLIWGTHTFLRHVEVADEFGNQSTVLLQRRCEAGDPHKFNEYCLHTGIRLLNETIRKVEEIDKQLAEILEGPASGFE